MKTKIKVLTTNKKIETLLLTKEELKQLKIEMTGMKNYIQEYKTINGKTITDLEIQSIYYK